MHEEQRYTQGEKGKSYKNETDRVQRDEQVNVSVLLFMLVCKEKREKERERQREREKD